MKKHTKYLKKQIEKGIITLSSLEKPLALLKELVENQQKIKKGKVKEPETGLCSYALGDPNIRYYAIKIFKAWPSYSGHSEYPVPSLVDTETPSMQYRNKSHYSGKVGELRFDLANFCVKKIEKDIKKLKRKGIINVD